MNSIFNFIKTTGTLLGWSFFIYYAWNDAVPWWAKKATQIMYTKGTETIQNLPKSDWLKPEETKPESKPEASQENREKTILSGEGRFLNFRSKYSIGIEGKQKETPTQKGEQ